MESHLLVNLRDASLLLLEYPQYEMNLSSQRLEPESVVNVSKLCFAHPQNINYFVWLQQQFISCARSTSHTTDSGFVHDPSCSLTNEYEGLRPDKHASHKYSSSCTCVSALTLGPRASVQFTPITATTLSLARGPAQHPPKVTASATTSPQLMAQLLQPSRHDCCSALRVAAHTYLRGTAAWASDVASVMQLSEETDLDTANLIRAQACLRRRQRLARMRQPRRDHVTHEVGSSTTVVGASGRGGRCGRAAERGYSHYGDVADAEGRDEDDGGEDEEVFAARVDAWRAQIGVVAVMDAAPADPVSPGPEGSACLDVLRPSNIVDRGGANLVVLNTARGGGGGAAADDSGAAGDDTGCVDAGGCRTGDASSAERGDGGSTGQDEGKGDEYEEAGVATGDEDEDEAEDEREDEDNDLAAAVGGAIYDYVVALRTRRHTRRRERCHATSVRATYGRHNQATAGSGNRATAGRSVWSKCHARATAIAGARSGDDLQANDTFLTAAAPVGGGTRAGASGDDHGERIGATAAEGLFVFAGDQTHFALWRGTANAQASSAYSYWHSTAPLLECMDTSIRSIEGDECTVSLADERVSRVFKPGYSLHPVRHVLRFHTGMRNGVRAPLAAREHPCECLCAAQLPCETDTLHASDSPPVPACLVHATACALLRRNLSELGPVSWPQYPLSAVEAVAALLERLALRPASLPTLPPTHHRTRAAADSLPAAPPMGSLDALLDGARSSPPLPTDPFSTHGARVAHADAPTPGSLDLLLDDDNRSLLSPSLPHSGQPCASVPTGCISPPTAAQLSPSVAPELASLPPSYPPGACFAALAHAHAALMRAAATSRVLADATAHGPSLVGSIKCVQVDVATLLQYCLPLLTAPLDCQRPWVCAQPCLLPSPITVAHLSALRCVDPLAPTAQALVRALVLRLRVLLVHAYTCARESHARDTTVGQDVSGMQDVSGALGASAGVSSGAGELSAADVAVLPLHQLPALHYLSPPAFSLLLAMCLPVYPLVFVATDHSQLLRKHAHAVIREINLFNNRAGKGIAALALAFAQPSCTVISADLSNAVGPADPLSLAVGAYGVDAGSHADRDSGTTKGCDAAVERGTSDFTAARYDHYSRHNIERTLEALRVECAVRPNFEALCSNDDASVILLSLTTNNTLEHVDISDNICNPPLIPFLRPHPTLKVLKMVRCGLTHTHIPALLHLVRFLPRLVTLDLSDNSLGDGFHRVIRWLALSHALHGATLSVSYDQNVCAAFYGWPAVKAQGAEEHVGVPTQPEQRHTPAHKARIDKRGHDAPAGMAARPLTSTQPPHLPRPFRATSATVTVPVVPSTITHLLINDSDVSPGVAALSLAASWDGVPADPPPHQPISDLYAPDRHAPYHVLAYTRATDVCTSNAADADASGAALRELHDPYFTHVLATHHASEAAPHYPHCDPACHCDRVPAIVATALARRTVQILLRQATDARLSDGGVERQRVGRRDTGHLQATDVRVLPPADAALSFCLCNDQYGLDVRSSFAADPSLSRPARATTSTRTSRACLRCGVSCALAVALPPPITRAAAAVALTLGGDTVDALLPAPAFAKVTDGPARATSSLISSPALACCSPAAQHSSAAVAAHAHSSRFPALLLDTWHVISSVLRTLRTRTRHCLHHTRLRSTLATLAACYTAADKQLPRDSPLFICLVREYTASLRSQRPDSLLVQASRAPGAVRVPVRDMVAHGKDSEALLRGSSPQQHSVSEACADPLLATHTCSLSDAATHTMHSPLRPLLPLQRLSCASARGVRLWEARALQLLVEVSGTLVEVEVDAPDEDEENDVADSAVGSDGRIRVDVDTTSAFALAVAGHVHHPSHDARPLTYAQEACRRVFEMQDRCGQRLHRLMRPDALRISLHILITISVGHARARISHAYAVARASLLTNAAAGVTQAGEAADIDSAYPVSLDTPQLTSVIVSNDALVHLLDRPHSFVTRPPRDPCTSTACSSVSSARAHVWSLVCGGVEVVSLGMLVAGIARRLLRLGVCEHHAAPQPTPAHAQILKDTHQTNGADAAAPSAVSRATDAATQHARIAPFLADVMQQWVENAQVFGGIAADCAFLYRSGLARLAESYTAATQNHVSDDRLGVSQKQAAGNGNSVVVLGGASEANDKVEKAADNEAHAPLATSSSAPQPNNAPSPLPTCACEHAAAALLRVVLTPDMRTDTCPAACAEFVDAAGSACDAKTAHALADRGYVGAGAGAAQVTLGTVLVAAYVLSNDAHRCVSANIHPSYAPGPAPALGVATTATSISAAFAESHTLCLQQLLEGVLVSHTPGDMLHTASSLTSAHHTPAVPGHGASTAVEKAKAILQREGVLLAAQDAITRTRVTLTHYSGGLAVPASTITGGGEGGASRVPPSSSAHEVCDTGSGVTTTATGESTAALGCMGTYQPQTRTCKPQASTPTISAATHADPHTHRPHNVASARAVAALSVSAPAAHLPPQSPLPSHATTVDGKLPRRDPIAAAATSLPSELHHANGESGCSARHNSGASDRASVQQPAAQVRRRLLRAHARLATALRHARAGMRVSGIANGMDDSAAVGDIANGAITPLATRNGGQHTTVGLQPLGAAAGTAPAPVPNILDEWVAAEVAYGYVGHDARDHVVESLRRYPFQCRPLARTGWSGIPNRSSRQADDAGEASSCHKYARGWHGSSGDINGCGGTGNGAQRSGAQRTLSRPNSAVQPHTASVLSRTRTDAAHTPSRAHRCMRTQSDASTPLSSQVTTRARAHVANMDTQRGSSTNAMGLASISDKAPDLYIHGTSGQQIQRTHESAVVLPLLPRRAIARPAKSQDAWYYHKQRTANSDAAQMLVQNIAHTRKNKQ